MSGIFATGTFSSKDLTTGKWLTQKEHDERNKKN